MKSTKLLMIIASAATIFIGPVSTGIAYAATEPAATPASDNPPVEPRGTCGAIANPVIGAGRAHWELHCHNGAVTVSGFVTDTRADGQCVKVKAVFEGSITEYSAAACPKGSTKNFSWTHPGSLADVYLFAYHV
ncbi:hypothetical protein OG203_30695 [Nocardia sp. NBC_01499]|uniref:hypothetical protein n=1 Tax=Nocardia sp. NBC_01499 TaxID=2903597 RepID=UPI0038694128